MVYVLRGASHPLNGQVWYAAKNGHLSAWTCYASPAHPGLGPESGAWENSRAGGRVP